jgi:hypothetical protein
MVVRLIGFFAKLGGFHGGGSWEMRCARERCWTRVWGKKWTRRVGVGMLGGEYVPKVESVLVDDQLGVGNEKQKLREIL